MSEANKNNVEEFPFRDPAFVTKSSLDPFAIFKKFGSIPLFTSVGLLIGAFTPAWVSFGLSLAVLLPSTLKVLASHFKLIENGNKKHLIRGRYTAQYNEDFVVFMIGFRTNGAFKVTGDFKTAGDYMDSILKELNDKPELGCLSSEMYVGGGDGSDTLLVQYWKSADHLQRFAHNLTNTHFPSWKWLMELGRQTDDVGFWHETFMVRKGEYESIYVNLPRIHLASARGSEVERIAGTSFHTMRGRLRKEKDTNMNEQWPQGLGSSTY